MLIMQFTDLLIIHFFPFLCFAFSPFWNPLVSLAMKTRQINLPKWPAKMSCHGNLLDSPARITRRIYSPEKSAISTRGLLARDPPFPAQNPQARPGPPTLPPPQQLRQWSQGEGAGSRPGPPTLLDRYFYFPSPFHEWLHILLWHDTYIFYTERINMKVLSRESREKKTKCGQIAPRTHSDGPVSQTLLATTSKARAATRLRNPRWLDSKTQN